MERNRNGDSLVHILFGEVRVWERVKHILRTSFGFNVGQIVDNFALR